MPDQSGSGNDGNKGVLCIPQSSNITGATPPNCLVSDPGHSLGESYLAAEKHSVYSKVPADWAVPIWDRFSGRLKHAGKLERYFFSDPMFDFFSFFFLMNSMSFLLLVFVPDNFHSEPKTQESPLKNLKNCFWWGKLISFFSFSFFFFFFVCCWELFDTQFLKALG